MTTSTTEIVSAVAHRFADTYTLSAIDPQFEELFAGSVEIRHNYDDDVLVLPGAQFAATMLRMLQATRELLQDGRDECTALMIGDGGFAMSVTASGIVKESVAVYIPRCLMVSVAHGRIVGISEFGDANQRAELDEALRAAGRFRV